MALPVIYWRGTEDIDYNLGGGSNLDGTAGRYRSGYARYAIGPAGSNASNSVNLIPWNGGAGASSFWFSSYVFVLNTASNNWNVLWFYDTNRIIRFFIQQIGTNTFQIFKRNAAGTNTSLGTFGGGLANSVLTKWDIQIVGGVSGAVNIYATVSGVNTPIFAFTGDTTTDGAAQPIAYHGLGNGLNGGGQWLWSEQIASDSDTRAMSLVVLIPTANGNTHNFDTGTPAAANINEQVLNQTTFDGSSVAGQIDQYTISGLPTGTFQILDIGITAQMMKGYTGPTKMDFNVRSGASPADYFSPDTALTTVWTTYVYDWPNDPSTSASWTSLPVNIGLRSVT